MADTVRSVEYYYVTVPDEPGEGQRILSALKDSGILLWVPAADYERAAAALGA
jgi:hypothetical protein